MRKITFLIVILFAMNAAAQIYMDSPEDGMRSAMLDYQNGKYEEAYRKFKSLADRYSLDGHNSSFRFMAAKS